MRGDLDPSQYIPKAELEHGAYYFGTCRNADIARWNAETQEFTYWREKFRSRFTETIKYPSDDQVFDIFYPFKRILGTQGLRPIRFEEEQKKLEAVQTVGRQWRGRITNHDDVVELPESGFLAFVRTTRQAFSAICTTSIENQKPEFFPCPRQLWHHVRTLLWRLEQYEVIVEPPKDDSLTQIEGQNVESTPSPNR
jgi:hypothetical protein